MTKATEQTNPLREGLSTRDVPQPCAIVIFGATGDLTHRKLIPALYNLAADRELPRALSVIRFARCRNCKHVPTLSGFQLRPVSDRLRSDRRNSDTQHRPFSRKGDAAEYSPSPLH